MAVAKEPSKISSAQGEAFLARDFNQCFEQMRHYDSQIVSIFQFMFAAYTTLIGIALGLYKFGLDSKKDLALPAIAVLVMAFLLGLFFFAISIRNRLYFVKVTRYLNEQRSLFLKDKPLGFENKAKMFTDPTKPPYFDWGSSQAWFTYIIATLNAILLGVLIFIVFSVLHIGNSIIWAVVGAAIVIGGQLLIGINYLKTCEENKE